MPDRTACEIFVTAPDADWLFQLSRQLVEARLCSGANVFPVRSVYRWEGAVREAPEALVLLRSRLDLVDAVTEYIVARHPYEVPQVTAIPISGGHPPYLAWVEQETIAEAHDASWPSSPA